MIIYYTGVSRGIDPRKLVPGSHVMTAFSFGRKSLVEGGYYFLDSGSFSLVNAAKAYRKERGGDKWSYYESQEHLAYLDRYIEFVQKYQHDELDLYANVDVISSPKLSHRNQQYLESQGLSPVPVIHSGTELKWVKRYVDRYPVIAFGGLASKGAVRRWDWVDQAFRIVEGSGVKVHGFGVTSYAKMLRYPWYSVDSTTWIYIAGHGEVIVPHKRKGKFVFDEIPYRVSITPDRAHDSKHINKLSRTEQSIIREWFEFIGIDELEEKVMRRRIANLEFFERARKEMPLTTGGRSAKGFDLR